jgi:hypothetical protein
VDVDDWKDEKLAARASTVDCKVSSFACMAESACARVLVSAVTALSTLVSAPCARLTCVAEQASDWCAKLNTITISSNLK